MANKHIKKCLTSFIIGEMQTKITVQFYFRLSKVTKIKKTNNPSVYKDVEQLKLSYIADENMKLYNLFGKQAVSYKAYLLYGLNYSDTGYYPREMKMYAHIKTC